MKRNRYMNKKVRNATPLTYYNKQFKSKLELHCYKTLKDANIKFKYEEHKYELIPKFIFKNISYELFKRRGIKTFDKQKNNIRAITYTPDFVGHYPHSKKLFVIETKGFANDIFPFKWKLFKYYLNINKIDADLYMPRNKKQIEEIVNIIKDK